MADICNSCKIEITQKGTKYCTVCGASLFGNMERLIDHSSHFYHKKSDVSPLGGNVSIDFSKNTRLDSKSRIPGMYFLNNHLLVPSFDDNCYYIFFWDGKEFIQKWKIDLECELKIVSTPISDGIFLNILAGNEIIRFRIKRNGEKEEFRHTFYPATINTLLADPIFYEKGLARYLITYLNTTSELLLIDISKKDVINKTFIKYPFQNDKIGLVTGTDRVFLYTNAGEIVIIPLIDLLKANILNATKLQKYPDFAFKPVFRDNHIHLFCKENKTLYYNKLDVFGNVIASNKTNVDELPTDFNYPILKDSHFLLPFNNGESLIKIFSNLIDCVNCTVKYSPNHYLVIENTSFMLSSNYESLIRVDNQTPSTFTAGMGNINVINDLCYGDGNIFIQTENKIYIKTTF